MKTLGWCHARSARKHKKMGHRVVFITRNNHGHSIYMWQRFGVPLSKKVYKIAM